MRGVCARTSFDRRLRLPKQFARAISTAALERKRHVTCDGVGQPSTDSFTRKAREHDGPLPPTHAPPPPGQADSNRMRVVRHAGPSGRRAGRCAARRPRDVARNLPVVSIGLQGRVHAGHEPDASELRSRSRRSIALECRACSAHAPDSCHPCLFLGITGHPGDLMLGFGTARC